jgi:predicted secreted hydrolase
MLVLTARAADYEIARPGYRYQFPRDHFNHPGYQTEWWYYTGNLKTKEGRRFGFELTFFRRAVARRAGHASPWQLDDLYVAHLALSDVAAGRFYYEERINRAGPGLAGASLDEKRVWNGNWCVRWNGEIQSLQAVSHTFTLTLELTPKKPPVIHGRDGVSRKGAGEGQASHYISYTRLAASGSLELRGQRYSLAGSAWMDHEFFTNQLDESQAGWDWMSIQLDNGADLMLFRLRRKDGSIDRFSAGTYIDPKGGARYLSSTDFVMEPGETWQSSASSASYPVRWRVRVAPLTLVLDASTPMRNQELVGKGKYAPTYWEGVMDYSGTLGTANVKGVGYLEMTGYDRPVTQF